MECQLLSFRNNFWSLVQKLVLVQVGQYFNFFVYHFNVHIMLCSCWSSQAYFAKVVLFLCDFILKELIQSAEIPERALPRWLYSYVICFWKSWYRVLKFPNVLCQGGCILTWLVFERADTECWNSRTYFAKVVVFLCDLFFERADTE